jgi:hypothetical protein
MRREPATAEPPTPRASKLTIGDLLEAWFPGRNVTADLERAVVRLRLCLEERAQRLPPLLEKVGEAVERLERMTPAPGYEPLLIERGQHPLCARMMSYFLIRASRDAVNQARMERRTVDAIRFLAKPGHRRKRATCRRIEWLLSDTDGVSRVAGLREGNTGVHEFRSALEAFARGGPGADERLRQTAAAIAPRLSVARGRKASRATIGHQFLLSVFRQVVGPAGYTWDVEQEDFTDPLTRATRLAFGDPNFDPRPAHRRERQRMKLVTSP